MKILILIILILLLRWLIKTVNGFQKKEIRVQESLSGIEVALTKRYDLLTKMLSTAKGYMEHERELFTRTIELRRGMSVGELAEADQKMPRNICRLQDACTMPAWQITIQRFPSFPQSSWPVPADPGNSLRQRQKNRRM